MLLAACGCLGQLRQVVTEPLILAACDQLRDVKGILVYLRTASSCSSLACLNVLLGGDCVNMKVAKSDSNSVERRLMRDVVLNVTEGKLTTNRGGASGGIKFERAQAVGDMVVVDLVVTVRVDEVEVVGPTPNLRRHGVWLYNLEARRRGQGLVTIEGGSPRKGHRPQARMPQSRNATGRGGRVTSTDR